jgi:hypothetical protein
VDRRHSQVVTTTRSGFPFALVGEDAAHECGPTHAVVWFADQVISLGGEPLVLLPRSGRRGSCRVMLVVNAGYGYG